MGCMCSSPDKDDIRNATNSAKPDAVVPANRDAVAPQTKTYSWDVRKTVDPKLYTVENIENEMVCRLPGTVDGNQFIIQNCKNTRIYIFDHAATVSVDDCVNCQIFLGPIKSSVFIRNCTDCHVAVACQQFRMRDCSDVVIFLSCTTQPIIESSNRIKFGCLFIQYPALEEQFQRANMSVYNNDWSDVHDFTPITGGGKNYSILPADKDIGDYINVSECQSLIDVTTQTSAVPRTLDLKYRPEGESCLVMFCHTEASSVKEFILKMLEMRNGDGTTNHKCQLVRTKEVTLKAEDATRIFGTDRLSEAASRGPCIGLEYIGDSACSTCNDVLAVVCPSVGGQPREPAVYASRSATSALKDIENFYTIATMQMQV